MEEGEIWEKIKEDSKKKRWSNKEKSLAILKEKGIKVLELNKEQAHYRIEGFDFWPTTGKFYNQKTKQKGRGVFNLIKIIKK